MDLVRSPLIINTMVLSPASSPISINVVEGLRMRHVAVLRRHEDVYEEGDITDIIVI